MITLYYNLRPLMKEEIKKLTELLSKHNIAFVNSLAKELNTLLKENNPRFSQLHTILTQYPLIHLARFFPELNSQDVVEVKKAVAALVQAAKIAWMNEWQEKSVDELAHYCAEITQDKYLLDNLPRIINSLKNRDKGKVINDLSFIADYLLMIGREKLSPSFLSQLERVQQFKFPVTQVTANEADEGGLQLSDFALYNTHFVDLPLDQFIEAYNIRFDCIPVRTNQGIQYHQGDRFYYALQPPVSTKMNEQAWDYEKVPLETEAPKLLSLNITNCHTVLIHEAKTSRFWMLHVSPGSLHGVEPLGNVPVKKAYIDLQPHYTNNAIGVDSEAQLDIYVIDARGNFREKQLRKRLPTQQITLNQVSTEIKVPFLVSSSDEERYKYHVCFDPATNSLMIKQKDKITLINTLFKKPALPSTLKMEEEVSLKSEQLGEFGLFSSSTEKTLTKDEFDNLFELDDRKYSEQVIQKMLDTPGASQRCITNLTTLVWTMKFASPAQKTQLVDYLCNDKVEFTRLITKPKDLEDLQIAISEKFHEQTQQKYDEYITGTPHFSQKTL